MPTTDGNDNANFQEAERDREYDRDKEKSAKTKASSKAKDLSHVPCKFFKVGSCTAGSSCPFSHNMQEPGGQKDVCTWFVKGNCKFGHKCALAHVLPGQSMAMDRKNKKAAQVAAGSGNNSGGGGKDGTKKGQKKDAQGSTGQVGAPSGANAQIRNPLLSGLTAPTRVLPSSSRPPITMPLKATISPSAPAPPLKDTDFASFGLPDENNQLPSAPAQGRPASRAEPLSAQETSDAQPDAVPQSLPSHSPPSPLPLSTPSAPRRLGMGNQRSPSSVDFGPIGSPPRSIGSPSLPSRVNGFSPSTSPPQKNAGFLSSSPFSAPGPQSVFVSYDKDESSTDFKSRSGIAASLGITRTWNTDFGPIPSQVTNRADHSFKLLGGDVAVEDEDLEDFLPSSLTDLLTPEEKSRRMSRSNSGQPMTAVLGARELSGQRSNAEGSQHRYSRSVPAPSLLGDIRSIWADSGIGLPASPDAGAGIVGHALGVQPGLGSGTPNSYKSTSGFGERSFGEDAQSPSLIPPSNASAAFLPGLHHHYLSSKSGPQRPPSGNRRGNMAGLQHPVNPGTVTPGAPLSVNAFIPGGMNGLPLSPPQTNSFGSRPPFDATSDIFFNSTSQRAPPSRPASGGVGLGGDTDPMSPSARALQAHAPGQSLPQGLAAGYSRIHALPPPAMIPSPSASGAFSQGSAQSPNANGHNWSGQTDGSSVLQGGGASSPNSGLETMFSRLSYSAATSRAPANHTSLSGAGAVGGTQASGVVAPGMVRNVSGRSWQTQGPLSPLSGPVVTGDDDDLFSMDG